MKSIDDFLNGAGFKPDNITQQGVLEIINLISDYHEEGNVLFPEVLITNNLNSFETIPIRELIISERELALNEFRNAIKLCAPLAINSWIIFIEIKDARIKFGIISAEISEASPLMYSQTFNELKVANIKTAIIYLRSIGQKKVEVSGLKERLIISLPFNDINSLKLNETSQLSQCIASRCDKKLKPIIATFFEKYIDEALKTGHGNLIGIIEDSNKVIQNLKVKIKSNGGIYLIHPIDFQMLIAESTSKRSKEAAINLKAYTSVLISMLNYDGITIISNKARIIGYHILIESFILENDDLSGGSRMKAFISMQNSGLFKFCLYKSQDGGIKIWKLFE
ncbi:hypothetical protein [Pontibacter vulgaris]|uniref:hypothetical protein n=1 Tax=Pontibacter vulgaris TaxID=2905679 RepID=UPI001FA7E8F6|nr:hypothetical protein [Pontibacter vulgaris]